MSHQIKRLRCIVLTAGSAGRNFPSTIYVQSSPWGPAATPAPPGPTAHEAAKAGALARHKPNTLSTRVVRCGAAASAVDFLTGKAAEAGEIIRFGWPLPDRDKPMPLDDRKRPRPTRAILVGWHSGPGRRVVRGNPGGLLTGLFGSHTACGPEQAAFGIRLIEWWSLLGRKEK